MGVTIFQGPMWAGKTTHVSKRIDEVRGTYSSIGLYKSAWDTRSKELDFCPQDETCTHSEGICGPHYRSREEIFHPCKIIADNELMQLCARALPGRLTVLEEAMLTRKNLLAVVEHFVEIGFGDLWLIGLAYTSEGEEFGEFNQCFPYAESIVNLRARCATPGCKVPASYTLHVGEKSGAIKTGDAGYSPRCEFCWLREMKIHGIPYSLSKKKGYSLL